MNHFFLNKETESNAFRRLQKYCIFIFCGLSLLHFFSPRPLGLDEGFIVENLQTRSYIQLFSPLEHAQAFPRIYLCIVKFTAELFDYQLQAIRIWPLVIMILAFFQWKGIFPKIFKSERTAFLATLGISCTYHIIYYAAEIKPYSMDVLIAALFLRFFIYQKTQFNQPPTKKNCILAALMPFLIFFSYAAVFFFWIATLNYLLNLRNNRAMMKPLFMNMVLSVACFTVLFQTDIRHGLSIQTIFEYWDSRFLCTDSLYCLSGTWWEGTRKFVGWWFKSHKFFIKVSSVFIPFFLYGLFKKGGRVLRKDRFQVWGAASLSLVLYLELIVLGIIKKYPFVGDRVTLFFAPFVILTIVNGIEECRRFKIFHAIMTGYWVVFMITAACAAFWKFLNFY